jgi:hypothetical protein
MLLPMALFRDWLACGSDIPHTKSRKEGQGQQQQHMIVTQNAIKPEHPFDGGAIPYANQMMIGGTASDFSPRVCQHRKPRPRLMLLPDRPLRRLAGMWLRPPPHHQISAGRSMATAAIMVAGIMLSNPSTHLMAAPSLMQIG